MTKQEYFDLLVKSASDGTFPSTDGRECLYRADRTPNCKQRCAVGLLIPDEQYNPAFEGGGVRSLLSNYVVVHVPEGLCPEHLSIIQGQHDWKARGGWDKSQFLEVISQMDCFSDVDQSSLQRV